MISDASSFDPTINTNIKLTPRKDVTQKIQNLVPMNLMFKVYKNLQLRAFTTELSLSRSIIARYKNSQKRQAHFIKFCGIIKGIEKYKIFGLHKPDFLGLFFVNYQLYEANLSNWERLPDSTAFKLYATQLYQTHLLFKHCLAKIEELYQIECYQISKTCEFISLSLAFIAIAARLYCILKIIVAEIYYCYSGVISLMRKMGIDTSDLNPMTNT